VRKRWQNKLVVFEILGDGWRYVCKSAQRHKNTAVFVVDCF